VVASSAEVGLWALDRSSFKALLVQQTLLQRDRHKQFLDKVNLLSTLTQYERFTVADALSELKVRPMPD